MKEILENEIEPEDTSSGDIEQPFDPKKIDITTKQMILEVFLRRLRRDEIDMNTFFQRETDLWDATKQSRLIESILIKLPLPAFYFDGSDDNKWLVVDGLQRLSVFKNYIVEKNFKLQDLEYLSDFNNKGFDDLPRELQRRIEEHEVTVYIINPGTPEDVKFNLFRRINTGGLVLTPQEIRNALNQGVPTAFIKELADLSSFKKFKINPKRANDQDFVTRFVAFYIHPITEYRPDLETFLNKSMQRIKKLSESERNELKKNFINAMDMAWKIFGNDAFRKRYRAEDYRKPINKSLFEIWSVYLSRLDSSQCDRLVQKKKDVVNEFTNLNRDKEFERSITSGTGKSTMVIKRHQEINKLGAKILNA